MPRINAIEVRPTAEALALRHTLAVATIAKHAADARDAGATASTSTRHTAPT